MACGVGDTAFFATFLRRPDRQSGSKNPIGRMLGDLAYLNSRFSGRNGCRYLLFVYSSLTLLLRFVLPAESASSLILPLMVTVSVPRPDPGFLGLALS